MTAQRLSISDWQRLAKEDPEQVVSRFFSRYEKLQQQDRRAFIAAHAEPGSLLREIKRGAAMDEQLLAGVPYCLQDMFDINGLPTRCGAPFSEPFEGTVDEQCLLAQKLSGFGAVHLAKTVPAEFGWSARGSNRQFGDCPHPLGAEFIAGGGAGASARAVSEGWAPMAFGLDTCAGIRVPAAFHGLYGFRMETNLLAHEGVSPIVPTLESVGWMTANIEDLTTSFEAFYASQSYQTNATADSPRGFFHVDSLQHICRKSKAGLMQLVRSLDVDDDPEVYKKLAAAFRSSAKSFQTIQNRELYAVHHYWVDEYRDQYDTDLLRQIEAGRRYSPAECEEASNIQLDLRACLMEFFRAYDYIVLPISPLASPNDSDWDSALEASLQMLNAPLSLSLLPALIIPFHCSDGKCNAAQIMISPDKLNIIPALLKRIASS